MHIVPVVNEGRSVDEVKGNAVMGSVGKAQPVHGGFGRCQCIGRAMGIDDSTKTNRKASPKAPRGSERAFDELSE